MAFSSSDNATVIPDHSILHQSPVKHIEWSIRNISHQPIDGILDSASVSFCGVKWFIRICTNGEKRTKSSGWISLYLVRKKSSTEHRVFFKIGIIKPDKSEFKTVDYDHTFESSKEYGWGNPKVIDRNTLLSSKCDVVSDGNLTVFCTFRIMDELMSSTTEESEAQTLSDAPSTLIQNLEDLCLKCHHADITIAVKGKEFRGHRSILSCRSSVFETILLNNKEKKVSESDEISDPDTFQDFLLFLYTGKVDIVSPRNAVSLYRYAEKYKVQDLKEQCVHCMLEKLTDDIFCDVFYLATKQKELDLLTDVTKYFIKNVGSIAVSEQWRTFIQKHPVLGNELFVNVLHSENNTKK